MGNVEKMGCFFAIIAVFCGILVVMSAIVVVLYGFVSAPFMLKIGLVVWVAVTTISFAFTKDVAIKVLIIAVTTLAYTGLLVSWVVEEYGDDNANFFVFPFISLVLLYYLGRYVQKKYIEKKEQEKRGEIWGINQQINRLDSEIQELEKHLENRTRILDFLELLDSCGTDVSGIQKNIQVSNISRLNNYIREKREALCVLHEKLEKVEEKEVF